MSGHRFSELERRPARIGRERSTRSRSGYPSACGCRRICVVWARVLRISVRHHRPSGFAYETSCEPRVTRQTGVHGPTECCPQFEGDDGHRGRALRGRAGFAVERTLAAVPVQRHVRTSHWVMRNRDAGRSRAGAERSCWQSGPDLLRHRASVGCYHRLLCSASGEGSVGLLRGRIVRSDLPRRRHPCHAATA